jgi:[ribosomal protein S18]-alanine N-acetyltransferase
VSARGMRDDRGAPEATSPAPAKRDGAAPDVRLRLADRHDVDAVAAIEQSAFSDPWSRASFASLVGNPQLLFAVADGAPEGADRRDVVGYVVAWFAADESEIANIAVAPAARGRGIGAALLDAALAEAARRGAVAAFLEVRESNAAARALYASRSFATVGRRRNYYRKPPEDALVLRRDLAAGASSLWARLRWK